MVEEELSEKDKELYDLKHELINAQIKLETQEKDAEALAKGEHGASERGCPSGDRKGRTEQEINAEAVACAYV